MSTRIEFTACVGCRTDSVELLLDFGAQPPSNRFFGPGEQQSASHILALGCCRGCGLVQLIRPMPPKMVRARHAWISYAEPEGHLDRMVDDLLDMSRLGEGARIFGLTYKDDTSLARFNRRGFTDTYRFDSREDLGLDDPLAGLESTQQAMTAERAAWLVGRHGPADLLLVRHVLEHAHAPLQFLQALRQLVKPGGFLVLEMPECSKFLRACDYSFVWEEHVSYFTAATVRRVMHQAGLGPELIRAYEYPLEDSLVAVTRPGEAGPGADAPHASELKLAADFGNGFAATSERIRADLSRLKREGGRVAIFGAGHLAVRFLNLFGLKDLVYCVIDDHPDKLGMCMPGSGLRVRSTSVLMDERIDLCLLALSPESEKKVIAARHEYASRGGVFRSIFALSPIAYRGTLVQ
jgi:SAM-dependent methyltransferase